MSLRSVDLQVHLPQVSEVNKNQQIQNQQSHTQDQQFAAQLQKKTENQRQQVLESNKSPDEGKIDQQTKGQHRGQDSERKGSKKEQEGETKASAKDPAKGNLLDIKI